MFRTVKDFEKSFKYESDCTLKILRALTDASLPAARRARGPHAGPPGLAPGAVADRHAEQGVPGRSKARTGTRRCRRARRLIVSAYEHTSQSVQSEIAKKWNDAALLEEHDLFGESWANGFTLEALLRHEAHHRGQMTVLMRQAGLAVPGIYGPSREEWAVLRHARHGIGRPQPAKPAAATESTRCGSVTIEDRKCRRSFR